MPCLNQAWTQAGPSIRGLRAIADMDRLPADRGQDPLGHASNKRGWITIGCISVLALLIQQLADAGQMLIIGLPLWILLFILLQVALTFTAAWMARS